MIETRNGGARDLLVDAVVVDHQDPVAAGPRGRRARHDGRGRRLRGGRQAGGKPESGSSAGLTLDPDFAGHRLHQSLAYRQTEACSSIFSGGRFVGLLKRRKQSSVRVGGNSDPGVSDGDPQEKVAFVFFGDAHVQQNLALSGKLYGVS